MANRSPVASSRRSIKRLKAACANFVYSNVTIEHWEGAMTVYHVYALVIIFAVLAASIWLAWYLDRKKAITNLVRRSASKAYWVVCYRSVSDPTARENYSKLGAPAVLAAGGRFLTRGIPAKTYEHGIKERTVVIEFDSLAQAVAAHDSPAYQAALAALGNGAERDLRIVEGISG
jgi:uncharacterized protein (DUF1330 family)